MSKHNNRPNVDVMLEPVERVPNVELGIPAIPAADIGLGAPIPPKVDLEGQYVTPAAPGEAAPRTPRTREEFIAKYPNTDPAKGGRLPWIFMTTSEKAEARALLNVPPPVPHLTRA